MALELENIEALAEELQDEEKPRKPTQAEILVEIAREAELWHTPDGAAWATVSIDGHREHWPLRSRGFRDWLEYRFHQETGKSPSNNAWQDAQGTLAGIARWEGAEYPVFVRVVEHDGAIYIDLANSTWQAVRVTPDGWQVVDNPPVRFRRPRGLLPLPAPRRGTSIDKLRPFVNVASDNDWRLLVAWLVMALRPTGPYPILVLQGEQGSAKSTTLRVLRSLVDPSLASLRTSPRSEQDLAIAASNGWVIGLDNLSGVPPWLSDALCRVATGGGFATRQLYTDDEEALFDYQRPVAINGIDDLATRHDLADRAIILTLPPISDEERRTEADFWREWEEVRPGVLGALLDGVAVAMGRVNEIHLLSKPRMADFAVWATAAEVAFGWREGETLRAYAENRRESIELGIEADAVAQAVRELLADSPDGWSGTTKELLDTLGRYASEEVQRSKSWPSTPRALTNRLRRSATALRQVGVEVEWQAERSKNGRLIHIRQKENARSVPSLPSPSSPNGRNPLPDGVSSGDGTVTVQSGVPSLSSLGGGAGDGTDDTVTVGQKYRHHGNAHHKPVSASCEGSERSDGSIHALSFSPGEEDDAPW